MCIFSVNLLSQSPCIYPIYHSHHFWSDEPCFGPVGKQWADWRFIYFKIEPHPNVGVENVSQFAHAPCVSSPLQSAAWHHTVGLHLPRIPTQDIRNGKRFLDPHLHTWHGRVVLSCLQFLQFVVSGFTCCTRPSEILRMWFHLTPV